MSHSLGIAGDLGRLREEIGEGNKGKTEERTEGPACFWRSQRDLLLCHTKKFVCDSEDKAHTSDFPSENK